MKTGASDVGVGIIQTNLADDMIASALDLDVAGPSARIVLTMYDRQAPDIQAKRLYVCLPLQTTPK